MKSCMLMGHQDTFDVGRHRCELDFLRRIGVRSTFNCLDIPERLIVRYHRGEL